jgi:hypothetical protein
MTKTQKVILSAFNGAAISFLTTLSSLYASLQPGEPISSIGYGPYLAGAIGALILALNKIQALLAEPPKGE